MKGIIFDFGGVMKNETDRFIFRDISQAFKREPKAIEKAAKKLIPELHAGKLTDRQFLKKLAQALKVEFKGEMSDLLVRSYRKKSRVSKPMTALVKKLGQNYQLLLLTNTFPGHARINRQLGWYDVFQKRVFSYREGLVKPDKRIYRLALKKLGLKARESVFIDDKKINLKPARELGLKTVHFQDYAQLKKDLRRLGFKIG
jgi:putative hydrolase of the HAD superfamily